MEWKALRQRLVILLCALVLIFGITIPLHAQGAMPPWFLPTFLNANGTGPNSLGFLCSFGAGTVVPAATYSDIALTVANQNPIRINAAGQPVNGSSNVSIYLGVGTSGGATSYKLIEYAAGTGNTCNGTAVGTQIRNVDQVPASAGAVTGSFTSGRVPFTTGASMLADSANLTWTNATQQLGVTGIIRALAYPKVLSASGSSLDILYDNGTDQAAIAAAAWGGSNTLKTLSITGKTVAILASSSGTDALASAVPSATFDWGGISLRGVVYRWPTVQGLVNTGLCNDGTGVLTWGGCGGGGGGLTGGGTLNTIPIWTGGTSLGNSMLTQDAALRYVTMTSANALGSAFIATNSNTASTTSYAQFTATDGSFGGQNTISMGITSPAFVGAPLAPSLAYIQIPAAAGVLAYTTNAAPFAFGINNVEVARFTSDGTPAFSMGSTTADDAVQIPFQVIRSSITGSAIETRNSNTGTTAWAGFTAKSGTSGSSNNMVAGVTSSTWVTSNGVTANQAFIAAESGSTGGMAIQTRNSADIFLEVNQVTKAEVTSNGLWINGAHYTWPGSVGGANTALTVIDANGQLGWQAPSGASGINGGGTNNFVAKFTPDGTHIGNSLAFDDGSTFYINATAGGTAQIPLLAAKNQNNASFFFFRNSTAGNLSQAEVIVRSDGANADIAIGSTSSTFTTANNIGALTSFVSAGASNTNGMIIQANGGPLTFNPSGTKIQTMTSAGIVTSLSVTTPIGLFTVAKDNADSGAGATAQIVVAGVSSTNERLLVGYNTTADNGFIQALHNALANEPLLLNPAGGMVAVNTTSTSAPGNFAASADIATPMDDTLGQIMAVGNADLNKRLIVGYDTTGDHGYLQASHHNTAAEPLLLNPSGGVVQVWGGNIAPDDATQIPFQVVNASSTGTQIETRNSTNGATAYAQLLAVAGAAASQNNVSIGVTPSNFTPVNGVLANQAFIFSGSSAVNGLVVKTRTTAPVYFEINDTEVLKLNQPSANVTGIYFSYTSPADHSGFIALDANEFDFCGTSTCSFGLALNRTNSYLGQVIPARAGAPTASGGTGNFRWFVDSTAGVNALKIIGPSGTVTTIALP